MIRGMHTVGTIWENPFPSMAELTGQNMGREQNGAGFLILAAIPLLFFMAGLAIATIPAAFVLLLICLGLRPGSTVMFREAYLTALLAIGLLLVVALAGALGLAASGASGETGGLAENVVATCAWLVALLWPGAPTELKAMSTPSIGQMASALNLVAIPLLLAVAVLLRWRLKPEFGKPGGWPRAIVAAALFTLLGPASIVLPVLYYQGDYAPGEALGTFGMTHFVVLGIVLATVIAFLLAWLVGPLVRFFVHAANTEPMDARKAYRIAWWAIAAAVLASLGAFANLRGGDEAIAAVVGRMAGMPTDANLMRGLPGLFKLALPGVLAGVAIAWLNHAPNHRWQSLLRSMLLIGPVCLLISLLAISLTIYLML